jgi:acetylxylan esterase
MLQRRSTWAAAALMLAARSASSASLVQVQSFGNNPSGAQMFIYVPDQLAASPPVLAAIHYCGGSAQAYYDGTGYKGLADQHGFIVVYPDAPAADNCWDVHSEASLKHDGGSDSAAIVSMVEYALMEHSGNAGRVYATGTSSGAMMTNVLLAAYPDVFKAGAAFAGVPHACFAGAGAWNSACATGQVSKSAQEWGDLVRAAYPGYTGPRPRMQLWHGTEDEVLDFNNFGEAIKQWTNVFGLSEQPSTTEENTPKQGFTRTRYNDAGGTTRVEAVREQGVMHNLSVDAQTVVHFFGLDGDADPGGSGGSSGGGGTGGVSSGGNAGTGGSPNGGGMGGTGPGSIDPGGSGPDNPGSAGSGGSASSSAGTTSTSAGTNGSGGATGNSPSATSDGATENDSSCSVPARSSTQRGSVLFIAGLAAMARRRKRRRRTATAQSTPHVGVRHTYNRSARELGVSCGKGRRARAIRPSLCGGAPRPNRAHRTQ